MAKIIPLKSIPLDSSKSQAEKDREELLCMHPHLIKQNFSGSLEVNWRRFVKASPEQQEQMMEALKLAGILTSDPQHSWSLRDHTGRVANPGRLYFRSSKHAYAFAGVFFNSKGEFLVVKQSVATRSLFTRNSAKRANIVSPVH